MMTFTKYMGASARIFGLSALVTAANAASLTVDFQATIASEQHPDYGGEARFYHVSVNPANPGIGSFAATIVGTNDPAPSFVRNFTGDVVSYKWIGGTNNDITGVSVAGGDDSLITYATTDTVFDGFAQNQLKLWTVTDPGADLATGGADPFNAVPDINGNGYRSFGGAVTTVDISGLSSGSVYVFYGAFNATPSVSAVMKDTDGVSPDIVIEDAHLNGDAANRTEYYVAQLKFVNDAGYDVIEYTHLANGTDFEGNGRGLGTLVTGADKPDVAFSITDISLNSETNEVTLTWGKSGAAVYIVKFSENLNDDFVNDLDDGITAASDENVEDDTSITVTLPLPEGLEGASKLFFRVEEGQ